jgi:hypothetical protein
LIEFSDIFSRQTIAATSKNPISRQLLTSFICSSIDTTAVKNMNDLKDEPPVHNASMGSKMLTSLIKSLSPFITRLANVFGNINKKICEDVMIVNQRGIP